MTELRLVDPLGERPLAAEDFPIRLGGAGCAVVLPGCAAGKLLAVIDRGGDELRIEPGEGATIRVNGRAIEGAVRLDGSTVVDLGTAVLRVDATGAVRRIVVEHEAVENVTLPPLVDEPADAAAGAAADALPIEVVPYQPPSGRPVRKPGRLPWGRLAVGAAALVVLAVLGLLLASVAVTVRTTPAVEPDDVDFAGTFLDVSLGGRHLVLPGRYRLEVSAEGYVPATADVEITRGMTGDIVVALERLPGRVRFDTGGIAAVLTVDGHEVGPLPGEYELAAGKREILIEAPRYEPFRQSLDVAGGGETQDLPVALEAAFAGVTVESVPSGARVSVDGEDRGVSPLEIVLDAGRYALAIEHAGFRRFETPITVKAGEPLKVGPVELGLPDGVLVVRTDPAGADVSVAGRYRGRAPVNLSLPPAVPHEIVVALAGYEPVTRTLSIPSGERSTLALDLEPILGEVKVRGEPADAELFVDGVSRGPANQTLALPAAPHAIEVRKAGLASFKATVTPRPDLPQVVEYALTTREQARMAALPAVVRTGIGQELRLVRGGTFVMGSPRREPGRRSNEAQRTIELKRPFYLGTREVTNREFREFRAGHASGIFKEETLDLDRQPAVRLAWRDAAAFCNWLSQKDGLPPAYVPKDGSFVLAEPVTTGYRLPTEAEWEFAARYDGSEAVLKYPWGNTLPVAARSGNYADQSAIYLTAVVVSGYDDGFRVAAPVGSFAANPLGIYDLGGNVSEWANDRYSIYVTGTDRVVTDPVGPSQGETWVIRGASWLTGRTPDLRLAWRDVGSGGKPDLGFRIARYAE